MINLIRYKNNPILLPSNTNPWEELGAYNGCVVKDNGLFKMVYRAQSSPRKIDNNSLEISSIGYAESKDGLLFENQRKLIFPENPWEKYGCEDPSIVKLNDKYYIFYTALSEFPFTPSGIKVGVAISKDLKNIDEKHLVTPFNAKSMSLFPEKINGKFAAVLTANTDVIPSKIALAFFDKEEEIWSENYWSKWYKNIDKYTLNFSKSKNDHVQTGTQPIKTKNGWLIIYAYIYNYFTKQKLFSIEAALLDLKKPQKIISIIDEPLLSPGTQYELYGRVPSVIFPSGAVIENDTLYVYYGVADTSCAVATCDINMLLREFDKKRTGIAGQEIPILKRPEENPIIEPIGDHDWEAKATFNPGAIYLDNKIHILYRAMSYNNISVIGYAQSYDGIRIEERLDNPIYTPRENFEKNNLGKNYGCENPRLSLIDNKIYMCYTAFNGSNKPQSALTSVNKDDFLKKKWNWKDPKIISNPNIENKEACIFPKKINNKYVFLHGIKNSIWIDYFEDLEFKNKKYLDGNLLIEVRPTMWDFVKVGIASPPVETEKGWILIYHAISLYNKYMLGAALLDLDNPSQVVSRLNDPVLTPGSFYEREGQTSNVIFPCGTIVKEGKILVYYGGADTVVAVATIELEKLLNALVLESVWI